MNNLPKAIILCQSSERVDYVYGAERVAKLAEISDLRAGVFSAEDLLKGDFSDVEYIFSTWGMPSLTEEQLDAIPNVKAVFYGAGATDNFFRPLNKRGIRVFSAWQANAIPVAEFCVAQIILSLKGFFRNTREQTSPEGARASYVGPGVYGERVVLIGAGAIASLVADMLKKYEVETIIIPSRPERRTMSFEDAFSTAMVVSNHLPDRADNKGCITGEHFEMMRPGAVFINTGRGAQVMEEEMLDVMERRQDLTALIDTPIHEPPLEGSRLYTLPNVLLSRHIAGSLNDETRRMADYMIDEYQRFISGGELRYEVSLDMLLTS